MLKKLMLNDLDILIFPGNKLGIGSGLFKSIVTSVDLKPRFRMNHNQFKFDFPIEQVLEEWKTLDENEDIPAEDQENDNDESNILSQESFFAPHYKDGIEYFSIKNPEKVKQEWLEARKLIIPHIQNVVKHLVREKFQK
ncbi:unnamed protein product [Schistosoma intercalatum]|nr:unnamed protein product [Schistosoma intercalatum]